MAHATLTKGYACFEINSYDQCGRRLDIANAIKFLIFFMLQRQIWKGKGRGGKRQKNRGLWETWRPILLTGGLCASADDEICSQRARRKWRDVLEHHKKVIVSPRWQNLLQECCVESVSSDSCSVTAQGRVDSQVKDVGREWETYTSPQMPMVYDIGNSWSPG